MNAESAPAAALDRRAAVAELLADRGDLLLVTGLGSPTWDCTAVADHPLNFYLWGAMGSAVAVALGLALAQARRRVLCVTGDGEMLMGLGSLATVAVQRPANLSIVVLDNERYGETGMQTTHTAHGVDLCSMARGAGFPAVRLVRKAEEMAALRPLVHDLPGPAFIQIKIAPAKLPMVLPPRDGAYLRQRFRSAVTGEGAPR
jgi:thiamine pyrophosphate-dependent acetolactate synthase large subunit-like protein